MYSSRSLKMASKMCIRDSVYNADVAARLALTVPDAYASAQKVTTAG